MANLEYHRGVAATRDRPRAGWVSGIGCLLALLLWYPHAPTQADAYRWRDAQGQVHYGDKPPLDAEAIEQVETFECRTEACREDLEQRRRDNAETNQQIEDWLQSRRAEREAARGREERAAVIYMPAYPPYPPLLVAPAVSGMPCLHDPRCSTRLHRGQRPPGRHHGGRPIYSDGRSSSRHSSRSYGFPVAK